METTNAEAADIMLHLLHAATTAAVALAKETITDNDVMEEDASPTHVEALFEVTAPVSRPRVVTFTTATTFVFSVAYGGSALPKESGPPIGMCSFHTDEFHEDLREEPPPPCRRRVRKFDHLERIDMLKRAKYHVQDIATFCMDAIDIRKSRQRTLDELSGDNKRKHDDDDQDETSECDAMESTDDSRRCLTQQGEWRHSRRMHISAMHGD
ncbi:hypothetical protein DYB25_011574 [Aphanomyces astaci]|uniref:Cysteine/serine-rich nuclear protein N-terminal domain-containing protein n=1 Tax=Aphanomyces astaci TaxID=112090 RepID=A0A397A9S9_APHAT|nr:hypothetical protein DYB25_011574 [Aphanomyces astaci]